MLVLFLHVYTAWSGSTTFSGQTWWLTDSDGPIGIGKVQHITSRQCALSTTYIHTYTSDNSNCSYVAQVLVYISDYSLIEIWLCNHRNLSIVRWSYKRDTFGQKWWFLETFSGKRFICAHSPYYNYSIYNTVCSSIADIIYNYTTRGDIFTEAQTSYHTT